MLKRLDQSLPVRGRYSQREKYLLLLLLFMTILMGSYIAHLRSVADREENSDPTAEQPIYATGGEQTGNGSAEFLIPGNRSGNTGSVGQTKVPSRYLKGKNVPLPPVGQGNKLDEGRTHEQAISPVTIRKDAFLDMAYFREGYNRATPAGVIPNLLAVGSGIRWDQPLISLDMPQEELLSAFVGYQPYVRNSFTASFGLISENLLSYGGLEAGLGYAYRLSPHWSFETGLGGQVFYKDGFENALALSSVESPYRPPSPSGRENSWVEERYQYDVKNSEIISNEVGAEYVMGIVDRLYYVRIPVRMAWQWRNTSVHGGVQLSSLLWATNQIRDYSDQYFNTVVLSTTALQNRHYFNRFDVSGQLSVQTKIWRGLSLYAGYNHGLIRIIRTDSGKLLSDSFKDSYESVYGKTYDQRIDYNRYFTIGMKYAL